MEVTRHYGLSPFIYINLFSNFVSIDSTVTVGHQEIRVVDFSLATFRFSAFGRSNAKNPYIFSSMCLMQQTNGMQINWLVADYWPRQSSKEN